MKIEEGAKLLSVKELATRLGRSERYVYAMKARGFRMPGGRVTLGVAIDWLASNNPPMSKKRI